jgi:hypothetical protein
MHAGIPLRIDHPQNCGIAITENGYITFGKTLAQKRIITKYNQHGDAAHAGESGSNRRMKKIRDTMTVLL